MATRYFKSADGKRLAKTQTRRRSADVPGVPEGGPWVEISRVEHMWRKQALAKGKGAVRPRHETRVDLVAELAAQGPEAVHEYCLRHYGHGSRLQVNGLVESV